MAAVEGDIEQRILNIAQHVELFVSEVVKVRLLLLVVGFSAWRNWVQLGAENIISIKAESLKLHSSNHIAARPQRSQTLVANIDNAVCGRLNPVMNQQAVRRLLPDVLVGQHHRTALALAQSVGVEKPAVVGVDGQIGVRRVEHAPHFELRRNAVDVVFGLHLQLELRIALGIDARERRATGCK